MIHLRGISLTRPEVMPATFPFNVPVIATLDALEFTNEVTFFVGENGSGKSTLLETIACAARLPTVGSDHVDTDPTLANVRDLSNHLRWSWSKRTRRGFFMRSEDFFGYAKRMSQTQRELRDDVESVQHEYRERSLLAQQLAQLPLRRELHAIQQSYGDGLDAQSHGESYFKLFRSRFVPNGLYLLDEPEAPLSPMRQLALLAMLKQMIEQGAQFIIATHSPIILAYPGALIYSFDDGKIQPCDYETLEHVTITRTFLNNPDAYLRHLLE
jgi:predicted ATPase